MTITFKGLTKGKQKSSESIRLLAVSTHITELSYTVSDIETRIFEIQELRHKSQSGDSSDASRVIDQSLLQLDERLESVTRGLKVVNESLTPLLESAKTPTPANLQNTEAAEEAAILRKYASLMSEWEAVQKESQVLREELKEDKWLTVFRTVTEQADGMMTSLEKAINRCQDFIYQVEKRGADDSISQSSSMGSLRSEKSPVSLDVYNTLLDSYEAKKKHYMPATTKVLSIIDKGVQDRVTKNGECLRRHAQCTQRWKKLNERIIRTDKDMETVGKILLAADTNPSEAGSSASGGTAQSRYLRTSPNNHPSKPPKSPSAASTFARSMSPFRKLARKIKKGGRSPVPETPPLPKHETRTPSSEPVRTLKHRSSLFNVLGNNPMMPDRPGHKYSQSLTPDSSPSRQGYVTNGTIKSDRPAWNSSTRVDDDVKTSTVKAASQRRVSCAVMRNMDEHSSIANGVSPYRRSLSRSSMASSRPWSPVTSSVSTAQSSTHQSLASLYRPPSRSQASPLPIPMTPRSRPKTPSHIPRPSLSHIRSMSGSPSPGGMWDDEDIPTSMVQRVQTPSGLPPRPPSRSMIPLPSVQISGASRPSSAMSNYRPDSSMSLRGTSKTPDIFRTTPRSSVIQPRLPPSSFKDSGPRTPGRPPSRSGAATPSLDGNPTHVYVPANTKDPLDNEVAIIANSMGHGLLIERIDPPLRTVPKDGEEVRAQYAFSNHLARKIVNCKLTTLTRRENVTKKVMCRVGGGWQDLAVYIANRQAGTA
ncbi:hypothetical protein BDY19DRAFT_910219 [Irpex rosettiformis]|uniref:Uncharacterized protein n=1 Tax=Irpex rosettiformis TaxID=378272 RepID=A0ACB8TPL6_9APHY|nr:hypothetical protein BDY19DRAFT_910219 [Irpex rosettiformis]